MRKRKAAFGRPFCWQSGRAAIYKKMIFALSFGFPHYSHSHSLSFSLTFAKIQLEDDQSIMKDF
tara:strand:+ start:398 stop:589 length:192 start_codon:yes stop_codon:yes gene_type:complete